MSTTRNRCRSDEATIRLMIDAVRGVGPAGGKVVAHWLCMN